MLFKKSDIYVTKFDYERIIKILNSIIKYHDAALKFTEIKNAENLLYLIKNAKKVDSKNIPDDYVTMNSIIELKNLGRPQNLNLRLVFPDDVGSDKNNISILVPAGTALLGSHMGKIIRWNMPIGEEYYQINKIIYQPEAAGDFHL